MKLNQILAGAALFAALGLAGCGSGDSGGTPSASPDGTTGKTTGVPAKKSNYKIVMIAKSSTNPVFTAAKKGAEDAAKEIGDKNKVKITVDWQTPNDEDAL